MLESPKQQQWDITGNQDKPTDEGIAPYVKIDHKSVRLNLTENGLHSISSFVPQLCNDCAILTQHITAKTSADPSASRFSTASRRACCIDQWSAWA